MLNSFKKKWEKTSHQTRKMRLPLTLWLFYIGILSMSLTGVTFSKYSTIIHGTISVQVADSYNVTFLDADGVTELASVRVYDGQNIENAPDMGGEAVILCSEDELINDLEPIFIGWSLDGEIILDLADLVVDREMQLIAVYEIRWI